ncbi:hypothetical protein [Sulfurimonas sp.]|uniref:hypothetical protein n=1 Tax=Sulfurimonas sp. TaxID=2022749 RepID=UPI0026219568|nr:hypothetical protein [Sulfurimonas sp.]
MKKIFVLTLLLLAAFSGCSDNDATITKSEKDLHNVKCMRLVIFPPNKFLETTMNKLYNFDKNCSYRLEISQKSGIVCNSNQNAARKTLSYFPSGFIRLDLYKGYKNIYSYYRDLTHKTTKEDVKEAFESLKESIN